MACGQTLPQNLHETSLLSTMKHSNESKSSLAKESVLNFLDSSLQTIFFNTCHS
jgi:hypothetical protein